MSWREVEKTMGDDMTAMEKAKARQEYMAEIEKINWKNVEKGLKTKFNEINWDEINNNLSQSITIAKIDSVQEVCNKLMIELNKINTCESKERQAMLLPDASIHQIEKAKADVQKRMADLEKIRAKKVVVRL